MSSPAIARTTPARSSEEVARRRAAGEPFHLATLLRGAAVDERPDELALHLALPAEVQRELLLEALVAGGAAPEIARAVVDVPRQRLVRDELRARAFLDEFHRASKGSGLTPQSLVAAMLERLRIEAGVRVLELGVGSGFHALAALRLGASAVVGIEADGEILEAARARLQDVTDADRLRLYLGAHPADAVGEAPFDRIYATFAHTGGASTLLPFVADGGLVQLPRPVLPYELAHEPLLAPERERFGSHERFFEGWQSRLCLTTYRREGERLRVVDKLFGVSFVGQLDEPRPSDRGAELSSNG